MKNKFNLSFKGKREEAYALDICVKSLAKERLAENPKCKFLAHKYVDYVYNKCKNDGAPFNLKSSANISNIIH